MATTFEERDAELVNSLLDLQAEDGFEGTGQELGEKFVELAKDYEDLRPAYANRYADPEAFGAAIEAVKKFASTEQQLKTARAQTPGEFEKQWHRLVNGG